MDNSTTQKPPLPELPPDTNPPYELKNIRRNDAQILDFQDWVEFKFDVEGDAYKHPEVWQFLPIPFTVVKSHIEYYYPEVGDYIRKIRIGIGGRGPKLAEICDVLESENFDWTFYIRSCLDKHINLLSEEKRLLSWQTTPPTPKQQKQLDDLLEAGKPISPKKMIGPELLDEHLETAIYNVVLADMSHIFDSDPKYILELKEILSREVSSLGRRLHDLGWKARNVEEK